MDAAYKAYEVCHFVDLWKKKKTDCYSLRFLEKAATKNRVDVLAASWVSQRSDNYLVLSLAPVVRVSTVDLPTNPVLFVHFWKQSLAEPRICLWSHRSFGTVECVLWTTWSGLFERDPLVKRFCNFDMFRNFVKSSNSMCDVALSMWLLFSLFPRYFDNKEQERAKTFALFAW